MTDGNNDTYVCERCGGTYEYERSVEDAEAEALTLFGVSHASTNEEMAIICDECFNQGQKLGLWNK
jgi:Fe2+ or Zn2+ uptake regulation protein